MYGEICDTHHDTVIGTFNDTFDNVNYVLHRVKEYNPKGRNQTEQEARGIDTGVTRMLQQEQIPYTTVTGDYTGINRITKAVLEILGEKLNWVIGAR
jgi:hypothetical protein